MNPAAQSQLKVIADLEAVLAQLIVEHRRLLGAIEAQQGAMKLMNLAEMEKATQMQEASRLRIATMDQRRRVLVVQIGKLLRLQGEPKIQQLAELLPHRKATLLKLRNELKQVAEQIAAKNHLAGKLAGALLGHLNTAVRLIAGAVEHAGLYTKRGMPQMAPRIGMMEAVG